MENSLSIEKESEQKWRSIKKLGFPLYKVSDIGNIKNIETGRLLKLNPQPSGYIVKDLVNEYGQRESQMLHVLIATVYIPNPENKKYVDHINKKRDDNRVCNLRWFTPTENSLNKDVKKTLSNTIKISQYDKNMKLIKIWVSGKEAADTLGFSYKNIMQVCKGDKKTHMKYIWRYYLDKIEGEKWNPLEINGRKIEVSNKGRIKLRENKITFGSDFYGYFRICINKKILWYID